MMLILGWIDLPLYLLLIPLVVILLYLYGIYPLKTWRQLGVPGPNGVPFFGNTPEIYDRKRGMRLCMKKWQREYGRIFGITLYRSHVLVVTDLEALRQIFVKDFNNYVDRQKSSRFIQPFLQKGLFFAGRENWQRIRRIITPTFSSAKLKLLTCHLNRTARQLVDSLVRKADDGADVEAKRAFAAFSLDVIAGTAFGLDLDTQNNPDNLFMAHAKSLMTIKNSLKLWLALIGTFPVLGKIFTRLFNIGLFRRVDIYYFRDQMYSLIQERKAHPEQFKQIDFIQLLMDAEADPSDQIIGSKKLSMEEVAAQCIVFVIAGYETSSSALQFLAYELARHQDIQAKLVEEIKEVIGEDEEPSYENCQQLKYTEAVINEILRMYPPLHFILRQSISDKTVTLQGISVPPDTRILIPLSGIGRDPEYFEDPDRFNPDRFLSENKHKIETMSFLPFGFGPRQCIGMRMAMLQLKIALVHVFRKVKIVDASPKTLELDDFTGILVPREIIKLKLSRTF